MGRFSNVPQGAATCTRCAAGQAVNQSGASACALCQLDFFQASTGYALCDACPNGKFRPSSPQTLSRPDLCTRTLNATDQSRVTLSLR